MYKPGKEMEEEKRTEIYQSIYDTAVDFEEEELFQKEMEELEKSENGEAVVPVIDLEKFQAEKRRLKSEIAEMEKYLQKMIDDAKDEAQSMKSKAYESGFNEGHKSGYEDGYAQGYEQAQQKVEATLKIEAENLLQELRELIISTQKSKREILDEYKEDLKDISVAIAEKIIHVSLKSSGDIIKRMIISATEGIMSKDWVKIYIAKCDAEMVVDGDTELISSLAHVSDHVKIILMENEVSGTCIIELPDKVIDASTNTQIENIKEIISSSRI
ncbi:MAG: FliH/SctL family protein [Proteocatella sp.]